MLWKTLRDVQVATRCEFASWLADKHHYVKCAMGWTRTLGVPGGERYPGVPHTYRQISARVWHMEGV